MTEGKKWTVFMDTSEFEAQNFDSDAPAFESLKELVDKGHVNVVITDVTVSEVESRIDTRVAEAQREHQRFRAKARILDSAGIENATGLLHPFDHHAVASSLKKDFHELLGRLRAGHISVDTVKPSRVFERYFGQRPPFSEGKKKSEFPDAFVLETLRGLPTQAGEPIHVVSRDPDMAQASEASGGTLLGHASLGDLLDYVTSQIQALASRWVHEEIARHGDEIKQKLKSHFENLGFWLHDQEGDVENVEVRSIGLDDPSIISLDEETAVVQIAVAIAFEADVSYDDLDTAIYDSEDKRLYAWRTIERTVEQTEHATAEMVVSYALGNPKAFEVTDLRINHDVDVAVMADSQW